MASKTLLTVEQFDRLPAEEVLRYELDRGELVAVSGPSYQHNYIRDTIVWLLRSFLSGKRLGEVIAEQEFRIDHDTVRRPDVAFIRTEAVSRIDRSKSILDVIPHLVVEIVSPNDAAEYVMRKVGQYLARGVQTVWIIYPGERKVLVYGPNDELRVAGETKNVEFPAVLPGFSVPVSQLFEE